MSVGGRHGDGDERGGRHLAAINGHVDGGVDARRRRYDAVGAAGGLQLLSAITDHGYDLLVKVLHRHRRDVAQFLVEKRIIVITVETKQKIF